MRTGEHRGVGAGLGSHYLLWIHVGAFALALHASTTRLGSHTHTHTHTHTWGGAHRVASLRQVRQLRGLGGVGLVADGVLGGAHLVSLAVHGLALLPQLRLDAHHLHAAQRGRTRRRGREGKREKRRAAEDSRRTHTPLHLAFACAIGRVSVRAGQTRQHVHGKSCVEQLRLKPDSGFCLVELKGNHGCEQVTTLLPPLSPLQLRGLCVGRHGAPLQA
jgi:hypothetical protein